MSSESEAITLTVDGQVFRVCTRAGEPGVYDFDWLSGPNGYGFTSARSDHRPMSEADAEEAIRDFTSPPAAAVGPGTG